MKNVSPNRAGPWNFEFDKMDADVAAWRIRPLGHDEALAMHAHAQGQLVMVLHGAMTCEVPGALWMAPVHGGLWIPGNVPHENRLTADADVCFLFVASDAADMPRDCCAMGISPLLRELILHLATPPGDDVPDGEIGRLHAVVLDQLVRMHAEPMHLPVSDEPRLRRLVAELMADPADRSTATQWASRLAMSERTFGRLVRRETGMSFGRWRQRLQLIVALQWLSSGQSVQQVAVDLGYDSVGSFIAMFKKAMGKPPARYLAEQRLAHGR